MKYATVTSIHKTVDITKPRNYKPVSILPIFSEISERKIKRKRESYTHRAIKLSLIISLDIFIKEQKIYKASIFRTL